MPTISSHSTKALSFSLTLSANWVTSIGVCLRRWRNLFRYLVGEMKYIKLSPHWSNLIYATVLVANISCGVIQKGLAQNVAIDTVGKKLIVSVWVICAPALKHKLKKFCIYRLFSEIVFLNCFLKETSQEDGRNKNLKGFYMEHWGSSTPQAANKFKMADRRTKFQETQ